MTAPITPTPLPIDPLLPAIAETLAERTSLILEAPPGAGKTTRVPLALLDAPWLAGGKILLLEPRRIAARAAARRMADTLDEKPGDTVGYHIRLDRVIGPRTRIEVITEGILTRRLQDDAGLDGVGLVIFDEFHERSLDADLGLALTLDVQRNLRPDLRLMVMSATLDGAHLGRVLSEASVLRSEGRAFPVETRYLDAPAASNRIAPAMAAALRKALAETSGDVLAFLPGEREIHQTAAALRADDALGPVSVLPLYGAMAQTEQDRVFAPAPRGVRKVVLATAIAETSLTIDGITVVVDSGFARVPRFDPASGLTRLETVKVSQAAAEQRRGRAGRTAPGTCYRLWPEPATRGLPLRAAPEILQADLAPLALELAVWGLADPADLVWLDPPPSGPYAQARALLRQLGALDADHRATDHGRRMARLPLHPRLAHMALVAKERGFGADAALLAALLGERDILVGGARDSDLRHRLELVAPRAGGGTPDRGTIRDGARRRIGEIARQIRRLLGVADQPVDPRRAASLVALAYPDRLAQRRTNGSFRMANGRGALLPDDDPLAREDWLAIAEVSGGGSDGRIFLAAPITLDEIESLFADRIETVETVAWDGRGETVLAKRQERLDALVLGESDWRDAPPDRIAAALCDGIRVLGLAALPWTATARQIQARVALLRALDGAESWPDLSDAALLDGLETWLAPHLVGLRGRKDLARLDLAETLTGQLDWPKRRKLDEAAPSHVTVPSGRAAALDYATVQPTGEIAPPVLAIKLQELFGLAETPRVAGGRVAVMVHLLSPAGRPVQVTRDLANFWRTGYPEVKKDLKGRYPRHPWPDDPLTAPATARTKRRSG